MPGVVVGSERFDLRARLGGGGGGVVYRAYDRARGHEVALKFLRVRDAIDFGTFRASFRSLSGLAHPNLVQLHELIEDIDGPLLVMELVDGIDLLRYVRRDGRACDELRVRAAFGQLAQGISGLHRARKVHRDVKPDNVRVTGAGRVVLLDLDLALDLDSERGQRALGVSARPVGTASYMAPEQAASLRLSPACDWYSMGVVLYEALTGVRPYLGSELEVLLEKQERPPAPPFEIAPDVPRDLGQLCIDLLTPDPSERPDGAAILTRLGVHEDALSARSRAAALLSVRPAFVGREPELARIEQALEQSRLRATVVRVTAHAGVGKSTLCEEALRRVVQRDARVLALASACPRYPERPHAPIHPLVVKLAETLREERTPLRVSSSALRLLERAFPGAVLELEAKLQGRTAAPPEPLEQRWRALSALRAILHEVAALRPVVLWLDDYHWADVDTQRLLAALLAPPDPPRMLVLLSEEPQPGSTPLSPGSEALTLSLGELSADEARTLTTALLVRAGPELGPLEAAGIEERLPLLLQERVRQALLFGERAASASFPELIGQRVRELPELAQRILELVCAAFDAIPQAVCERAAEVDPATFTRHVSTLVTTGLVRSTLVAGEDVLLPSHPLIAELVDLELSGPRRAETHRRLAAALTAHDAARASGRLLRHQGESGDHTRAAASARLAAEQAYAALAFQRAAELFSLGSSLKPPPPDERGHRLLRRMADALSHAGWALSAATVYREAALHATAADALYMRQRSMEHLFRGAELDEGEQLLSALLESVSEKRRGGEGALWSLRKQRVRMRLSGLAFREADAELLPQSELRKLDVLFTCAAQLSMVDEAEGAELAARALSAARALGEPQRMARAFCTEAWSQLGRKDDHRERSERLLDAARALSERHGAPLIDGHLRLAQGMLGLSRFDARECSSHCRDAERVFRDSCADVLWELGIAQVHQLLALSFMGSYRELAPKLTQYLREAEERGDMWSYSALLGVSALGAALADDAPERAREQLHEASSRWGERHTLHVHALLRTLGAAGADLYLAHPGAEQRLAQRLSEADPFARAPLPRIAVTELRLRTRVCTIRLRSDLSPLRALEVEVARMQREGGVAARGFGNLLLANVHGARGQQERAVPELERGIALLAPLGLGQWVLPAQLTLGRLLGGERGTELARASLAQLEQQGVRAVERYTRMMMPGFGERA